MRQSFDLLTLNGWKAWWMHRWSWWVYSYITDDTGRHLLCLLRGHIDLPNHIGGATYCQRCYVYLRGAREE